MKSANKFVLWLMGPTSSGKTSIAHAFYEKMIAERNIPILHYDGDEIRDMFGASLGFEKNDRMKVVKTLVHFANKSVRAGIPALVSALTANHDAREYIAHNVDNLIVGYIQCSIETCIRRDPKGLYQKALKGEIDTLPGVNTLYLPPDKFDFIINTEDSDTQQSVDIIENYLRERGFLL